MTHSSGRFPTPGVPRNAPPLRAAARTLGVPPTATERQLSGAYHRLVLQFHPDRQHGASDEVPHPGGHWGRGS